MEIFRCSQVEEAKEQIMSPLRLLVALCAVSGASAFSSMTRALPARARQHSRLSMSLEGDATPPLRRMRGVE